MEMKEDQKIDALILNIRNQFHNLVKLTQLPQEMAADGQLPGQSFSCRLYGHFPAQPEG